MSDRFDIRYDEDAEGYRVDRHDNCNRLLGATSPFPSMGDAQKYQRACEQGAVKFKAATSFSASPLGTGVRVAEAMPAPSPPAPAPVPLPMIRRNPMDVNRTSAGLRNALFDEIDALRNGTGDPKRAMAIAKLAQNILTTAQMEYRIQKAGQAATPPPLLLGDLEC